MILKTIDVRDIYKKIVSAFDTDPDEGGEVEKYLKYNGLACLEN